MTHETPIKQRLQITFGKEGALKYTGHLDTARLWERVLRRAEIPILYTQGFNARPRIQIASPLPLGITSECEIVDVMLREPLPALDGLGQKLQSVSPAGLIIYAVAEVPPRDPALQTRVRSAEYRITFVDDVNRDDLQAKIGTIMAAGEILKQKKAKRGRTKTINVRPLIHSLELDNAGNLIAHLATGDQGNLRPDDLLKEMGLSGIHCNTHRFRLHMPD